MGLVADSSAVKSRSSSSREACLCPADNRTVTHRDLRNCAGPDTAGSLRTGWQMSWGPREIQRESWDTLPHNDVTSPESHTEVVLHTSVPLHRLFPLLSLPSPLPSLPSPTSGLLPQVFSIWQYLMYSSREFPGHLLWKPSVLWDRRNPFLRAALTPCTSFYYHSGPVSDNHLFRCLFSLPQTVRQGLSFLCILGPSTQLALNKCVLRNGMSLPSLSTSTQASMLSRSQSLLDACLRATDLLLWGVDFWKASWIGGSRMREPFPSENQT